MIENCEKYKKFIKACGVGSRDKVANSINSYVSYLKTVSRYLDIPINSETLASIDDPENLSKKLEETSLSKRTINNCRTAMRHYVSMVKSDVAKERTQVERLTRDLAQALDENRKLKELVASYEGATIKELT